MTAQEPAGPSPDDRLFRRTLGVVLGLAGVGAAAVLVYMNRLNSRGWAEVNAVRQPEIELLRPFMMEVERLSSSDCPRIVYDPRIGVTKPQLTIEVRYTCASKSLLLGGGLKPRAEQLRALLETRYPKYSEVTTFRVVVWSSGSVGGFRWQTGLREVSFDESGLHPLRPAAPLSSS